MVACLPTLSSSSKNHPKQIVRAQCWKQIADVIQKQLYVNQIWQCTPIICSLRRLRQEDHDLKANLGYILKPCLKNSHSPTQKMQLLLRILLCCLLFPQMYTNFSYHIWDWQSCLLFPPLRTSRHDATYVDEQDFHSYITLKTLSWLNIFLSQVSSSKFSAIVNNTIKNCAWIISAFWLNSLRIELQSRINES